MHKGWLPIFVFYEWLNRIMELNQDDRGNMALFPCDDPRTKPFRIGWFPHHGKYLPKGSEDTIKAGHYMLFKFDKASKSFVASWPTLVSANFKRRSRSPSQTCTPSPSGSARRNAGTRIDVRMRDRRCLVTGQAAVKRARGGNFTGLEVAHIFPLMGVGDDVWTELLSTTAQKAVLNHRLADRPCNAILLRADIHSLFDDYQWSIWFDHGKARIVRFERSGATVLEHYDSADLRPATLDTIDPCSMELLDAHLRVALLIHVKGVGKRPVAGFLGTLL